MGKRFLENADQAIEQLKPIISPNCSLKLKKKNSIKSNIIDPVGLFSTSSSSIKKDRK
jgi:hypothetical protein